MAKPGPKPRADVSRRKLIALRVTPQEHAAWKRAAGSQPLSDWIREQCNRIARA